MELLKLLFLGVVVSCSEQNDESNCKKYGSSFNPFILLFRKQTNYESEEASHKQNPEVEVFQLWKDEA